MKIFNWARRFNHKENATHHHHDDHKSRSINDFGLVENNSSKGYFGNCVLQDGWKLGGILTVGTLGYHPLVKDELENNRIDEAYHQDDDDEMNMKALICNYIINNEEESAEKQDAEDVIFEEADHHDQIIQMITDPDDSEEEENNINIDDDDDDDANVNEEVKPLMMHAGAAGRYVQDYQGLIEIMKKDDGNVDGDVEFGLMEDARRFDMKIKERTTLADLFSSDDEDPKKNSSSSLGQTVLVKEKVESTTTSTTTDYDDDHHHQCNKLSIFSKKLNLIGGDQGKISSIHKLQRLMRRMLKRKIHPDLALNKHINIINPADDCSKLVATNDSTSLLSGR